MQDPSASLGHRLGGVREHSHVDPSPAHPRCNIGHPCCVQPSSPLAAVAPASSRPRHPTPPTALPPQLESGPLPRPSIREQAHAGNDRARRAQPARQRGPRPGGGRSPGALGGVCGAVGAAGQAPGDPGLDPHPPPLPGRASAGGPQAPGETGDGSQRTPYARRGLRQITPCARQRIGATCASHTGQCHPCPLTRRSRVPGPRGRTRRWAAGATAPAPPPPASGAPQTPPPTAPATGGRGRRRAPLAPPPWSARWCPFRTRWPAWRSGRGPGGRTGLGRTSALCWAVRVARSTAVRGGPRHPRASTSTRPPGESLRVAACS